ncbi:hypothetical protein ACFL59_02580 [Planctomycetota bacterium]
MGVDSMGALHYVFVLVSLAVCLPSGFVAGLVCGRSKNPRSDVGAFGAAFFVSGCIALIVGAAVGALVFGEDWEAAILLFFAPGVVLSAMLGATTALILKRKRSSQKQVAGESPITSAPNKSLQH